MLCKILMCLKNALSELKAFKSIAKDLLVMVDEWNLTKCGKGSKVRDKIHDFKILFERKRVRENEI